MVANEDADPSGQIIVTASRRPERLQDTALSISALSADQLRNADITNTASLQTAVPALNFSTTAGISFIYLRGVGSNVYGTFSDNSVATYVDGVYIPRTTAAIQELFDVDRVEVLRGPQATLYGRNATGGAILINTAAPTDYFTAAGDLELGNYDNQRIRGMVSGPLADRLSARISFVRDRHDGYSRNLANGTRYDDQDFWGMRGSLLFKATSDLSFTLTGNYDDERGAPGATKAIDSTSFPFRPRNVGGAGQPFSSDPRASYHDLDNQNPQKSYGAHFKIDWETGLGQLRSITSWNRYKLGPVYLDIDDSGAPLLEYLGETGDTKFFYQDFDLTSHQAGPFEWLAGATYSHEDTDTYLPVVTPGGPSSTRANTRIDSYAGYAQFGYKLTPTLKLVGGLRYSSETRSGSAFQLSTAGSVTRTNKKTWNDVSPRASLEFRPTNTILAYVSVTKGFKSGAFDPINVSSAANPETIWNYEAGLRSQFLHRRLTLNATAFHYDYRNLQIFNGIVQGPVVSTFLQNAGRAKVDGFEFEPSFAISRYLRIGGTLALLNGRFVDGTVLPDLANARPGRPPSIPAVVNYYDVGGNRMIQSPKVTGTAFIDINVPFGKAGRLELYGDYFRQSSRYFTAFEDPTLRASAYDTVNARATYYLPGDKLYVAAFVRNAGNTLIVSYMSRTPPFGTLVTYQAPRLVGAELGFRY